MPDRACNYCDASLPPRRRKWCSDNCANLAALRRYGRNGGTLLRYFLYERDKGTCATCGLDCEALERRLEKLRGNNRAAWEKAVSYLGTLGFDYGPGYAGRSTLWDADHKVPLAEGGSWHPDNAQTLCQPCHKQKTAEQSSRKAKTLRTLGWKHARWASLRRRTLGA